ncbi:hypothetical protein BCR39DRAFT_570435, partial [Naematelia encephala]
KPRSCTECIRRKTRCNKQIPCDLCLKRGVAHLCHLDAQFVPAVLSADSPPLSTGNLSVDLDVLRQNLYSEIDQLRKRVSELEKRGLAPGNAASEDGNWRAGSAPRVEGDVETEDAATTLEFFALGLDRRAGADGDEASRVPTPDRTSAQITSSHIVPITSDRAYVYTESITDSLLPRRVVHSILSFAERQVAWQHCCVFFPTFWLEVDAFWSTVKASGSWERVEPSWVALFFVLQGIAVHQMTDNDALACGLAEGESYTSLAADRYVLPNALVSAAEDALYLGQFLSRPTIWACQAIAILALCGHNVCDSDLLSSLLAIGIKTAQTLNLHSLGRAANALVKQPGQMNAQRVVEVEVGKRVWWALVMEDWFAIPFRGVWSVHPGHFDTPLPNNCHDSDIIERPGLSHPDSVLTVAFKQRFSSQMSAIVQSVFDRLRTASSQSAFAVAEEHAQRLRKLLSSLPAPLRENARPSTPSTPPWARAMRHYILISGTHKLLIIYRAFLARGGSSSQRAKAHAACVETAESIIAELERGGHDPETVQALWTIPYHSLAASVVLALDMISLSGQPEALRRKEWVLRAKAALERLAPTSRIARRGLQVLADLFREAEDLSKTKRRRTSDSMAKMVKKIKLPSDELFETPSVTPTSTEQSPSNAFPQNSMPGPSPDWAGLFDLSQEETNQLLSTLQESVPNVAALFDGSIGNFTWSST